MVEIRTENKFFFDNQFIKFVSYFGSFSEKIFFLVISDFHEIDYTLGTRNIQCTYPWQIHTQSPRSSYTNIVRLHSNKRDRVKTIRMIIHNEMCIRSAYLWKNIIYTITYQWNAGMGIYIHSITFMTRIPSHMCALFSNNTCNITHIFTHMQLNCIYVYA